MKTKEDDNLYQKGLEDAWEIARKACLYSSSKDGIDWIDERRDCFGRTDTYDILHMTVSEAKEKYDAWKAKKKSVVRVGDLIHTKRSDREMVVTGIVGSVPTYHAVDIMYGTCLPLLRNEFVTTGKHYDLPWLQDEKQNDYR